MKLQPHDNWTRDMVAENQTVEILTGEIVEGVFTNQDYFDHSPISLNEVIHAFGSFPPYSLLFGMCEDGLPLMLNLKDPRPGSLLIQGNFRCGKTQVLKTALASAAELNPVERVNFCVITPKRDEMSDLYRYPHCQGLAAPFDRQASEIILELSALTEQRRFGRELGPTLILAIDDLSALVGEHLDYEVLVHLRWLISKGPASQIWTIATLPYRSTTSPDPQTTTLFRTRLSNGSQRRSLNQPNLNHSTELISSNQVFGFATRVNRQTVRFIPLDIG